MKGDVLRASRRNSYTFQLRSCDNPNALQTGKKLHSHIQADGLQGDTLLANLLVQMYGKCGSVEQAYATFSGISNKNVFSYSIMITAYVHHGEFANAIYLYINMEKAVIPDDVTNVGVVTACTKLGCLAKGKDIHGLILSRVGEPGTMVHNALITMYHRCGSLAEARRVFERMPRRNVISWNAIIAANAQCVETAPAAVKLINRMDCEGEKPNLFTFCGIIAACSSSPKLLNAGREAHVRAGELGLETHVVLGTALITMYGKCGRLEEAEAMFEKMKLRNVVTWNAMAAAFDQNREYRRVVELYVRMDVEPDTVTYTIVLSACASSGDILEGKRVDERLRRNRFLESDPIVQNALLNLYAKCGQLDEARRVLERYSSNVATAWNSLIAAYAQLGQHTEAEKLYQRMLSLRVCPDAFTFATLLGTLTALGATEEGKQVHKEIVSRGFQHDEVVQKSLVNMHAKCGNLDEAGEVFSTIKRKDTISWTCMILGYSQHGRALEALELFRELVAEGLDPDYVTYTSILNACSHKGLVEVARQLLMWMKPDYGIDQTLEHFHCVIDMLARLGRLEEAEELVKTMPFEYQSDSVAWSSLLSAYRNQQYQHKTE